MVGAKNLILIFSLIFTQLVNASIIRDDNALDIWTGDGVHDFEGYPLGPHSGILNSGIYDTPGAQFGESFIGQNVNDVSGWDVLTGTPLGSLQLNNNLNSNENFGIFGINNNPLSQNGIFGANNGVFGTGAISILLAYTTDVLTFVVTDTNGGDFTVDFFGENGEKLGTSVNNLNSSNMRVGFRATNGELIKGISITNNDLNGIGVWAIEYKNIPTKVSEPTALSLIILSLIILVFRRTAKSP